MQKCKSTLFGSLLSPDLETSFTLYNHQIVIAIDGVMVSMLASSVVDYRFEHRSCQTKDYKNSVS